MKKLQLKIIKLLLKLNFEFTTYDQSIWFKDNEGKLVLLEIKNSDSILMNEDQEFDFRNIKLRLKKLI